MAVWSLPTGFIVAAAIGAASEPSLDKVRAQMRALDYRGAARTLTALEATARLSHDDVLQYYELSGVVAATMKNAARAREAFKALVNLDPSRKLTGRYTPRVLSSFYEAKASAEGTGPLTLEATADVEPGAVKQLAFEVRDDVLDRVATVVIHLEQGTGDWKVIELPRSGGSVACQGERARWWAELLNARGWVLQSIGDATTPRQVAAPAKPAEPEPTPPAADVAPPPSPSPPAAATVSTEPAPPPPMPSPRFRGAAVALGVVGALGLGAGGVFGYLASSERQRITAAEADADGVVQGLTRQAALGIDRNAQLYALVADVCFAAAGVLAATGVGLFIAGIVWPDRGGEIALRGTW